MGPSFFLDSPSCAILYPHPLKLSSGSQSQSSLWPLEPELQYPAPTCPSRQTEKCLRLGSAGCHQPFTQISPYFALHIPVASFLSEAPKCPFCPHQWGDFPVCEAFPLHNFLPEALVLSWLLSLSLFFLLPYLIVQRLSWPFESLRSSAAFSRCSVRVVPRIDIFLIYEWKKVSSTSYFSTILIPLPSTISLKC